MGPNEYPESKTLEEVQAKTNAIPSRPARVESQKTVVRKAHSLIDKVYNWKNLWTAWRKVRANKGTHGLDRMTIRAFEQDVENHLRELQRKLMENRYEPLPVRRVYIPKGNDPKKLRPLGIPTVTDRVCQQAVYQVLSPVFEPGFSDRSYGFITGRKAHHAIATVIQDAKEGYRSVLDADIDSFFDNLDHGVVMSFVSAKVADGRVLRLLEAFLTAGVWEKGVVSVPTEGSPQGGVISPLISNIVLDNLDKAIEAKSQWRITRYADDFVILTKSPEEAAEALAYVKEVLGKLKLSLQETKTRLTDFEQGFEFLGFRFRHFRLGIRDKSIEKFRDRVRQLTRRQQGRNVFAVTQDLNALIRGWVQYFGVGDVRTRLTKLNRWVRMRVRAFKFKRRSRLDNKRLPNQKLEKWGLLSMLDCMPALHLSYMRARTS